MGSFQALWLTIPLSMQRKNWLRLNWKLSGYKYSSVFGKRSNQSVYRIPSWNPSMTYARKPRQCCGTAGPGRPLSRFMTAVIMINLNIVSQITDYYVRWHLSRWLRPLYQYQGKPSCRSPPSRHLLTSYDRSVCFLSTCFNRPTSSCSNLKLNNSLSFKSFLYWSNSKLRSYFSFDFSKCPLNFHSIPSRSSSATPINPFLSQKDLLDWWRICSHN